MELLSNFEQQLHLRRDQELAALVDRSSHQDGYIRNRKGRLWEYDLGDVHTHVEVKDDVDGNDWSYIVTITKGVEAFQLSLCGDDAPLFSERNKEGSFVTAADPGNPQKYHDLVSGFINQLNANLDDISADSQPKVNPVVSYLGRLTGRELVEAA